MSKFLSVLFLLVMASVGYSNNNLEEIENFCSKTNEGTEEFIVNVKTKLNVRQLPDVKSGILRVLDGGQIVEINTKCGIKTIVADKFGRWMNLQTGGYVFSSFLKSNNSTNGEFLTKSKGDKKRDTSKIKIMNEETLDNKINDDSYKALLADINRLNKKKEVASKSIRVNQSEISQIEKKLNNSKNHKISLNPIFNRRTSLNKDLKTLNHNVNVAKVNSRNKLSNFLNDWGKKDDTYERYKERFEVQLKNQLRKIYKQINPRKKELIQLNLQEKNIRSKILNDQFINNAKQKVKNNSIALTKNRALLVSIDKEILLLMKRKEKEDKMLEIARKQILDRDKKISLEKKKNKEQVQLQASIKNKEILDSLVSTLVIPLKENYRKLVKNKKIENENLMSKGTTYRDKERRRNAKKYLVSINSEISHFQEYNNLLLKLDQKDQKYGFKLIKCLEQNVNGMHVNENKEVMVSDFDINEEITNEIDDYNSKFSEERWKKIKFNFLLSKSNFREKISDCSKSNEQIRRIIEFYEIEKGLPKFYLNVKWML